MCLLTSFLPLCLHIRICTICHFCTKYALWCTLGTPLCKFLKYWIPSLPESLPRNCLGAYNVRLSRVDSRVGEGTSAYHIIVVPLAISADGKSPTRQSCASPGFEPVTLSISIPTEKYEWDCCCSPNALSFQSPTDSHKDSCNPHRAISVGPTHHENFRPLSAMRTQP